MHTKSRSHGVYAEAAILQMKVGKDRLITHRVPGSQCQTLNFAIMSNDDETYEVIYTLF